MPVINLTELRAALPRGQRLIGLDPGARTIGVALSDTSLLLASPYGSIPRGKLAAAVAAVQKIVRAEGAGGLVVGLPLSLDGSAGPAAQAARDWTHALSAATGLPAALWDERLSSAAVNRLLVDEADMSRKRRAALVDKLAAAYILQAALDASVPARPAPTPSAPPPPPPS
jgi:putative Holliday junction resolvase